MSKISEKLGYIHGLMDGLKLTDDDDIVKLLGMIVEVLDDVSSSIAQLEDDQQELNDYVENIDDDLADLEMQHRDDDDDDDFGEFDIEDEFELFTEEPPRKRAHGKLSVLKPRADDIDDDDIEDEDDDEGDAQDVGDGEGASVNCLCPECDRYFIVENADRVSFDQKYECPYCKAHVYALTVKKLEIPVAKPVED